FWISIILFFVGVNDLFSQTLTRKTILDFKEELKLTKEQEEKIRKIISEFEQKVRQINERAVKVDREIGELLEKDAEMKEIEKKVKELFSLRAEAVIEELKAGRAIDKLLNEEQRKKWREIRRGGAPKGQN
ncbi:Spy/CpxP family protein refolding chaperone, partial [Saccharolobus sp.]|uniref:Spy/CpxP family protein refolding chaperone n=1 Tax=Saccharolobus sp. TaxID=2100761 RepID=UPI00316C8F59